MALEFTPIAKGGGSPLLRCIGKSPQTLAVGEIKFDASYPTGGESLPKNMTNIIANLKGAKYVFIQPIKGYTFEYDAANKKVIAYSTAATEVADKTDLSALTAVPVIICGY
jgi:hypothetical protein